MTHSFTWKITREEAKLKLLIYVIMLSRNGNGCFGEPSRQVKLRVVISPWNTSARIWIPYLIRRGLTSQIWVMFYCQSFVKASHTKVCQGSRRSTPLKNMTFPAFSTANMYRCLLFILKLHWSILLINNIVIEIMYALFLNGADTVVTNPVAFSVSNLTLKLLSVILVIWKQNFSH